MTVKRQVNIWSRVLFFVVMHREHMKRLLSHFRLFLSQSSASPQTPQTMTSVVSFFDFFGFLWRRFNRSFHDFLSSSSWFLESVRPSRDFHRCQTSSLHCLGPLSMKECNTTSLTFLCLRYVLQKSHLASRKNQRAETPFKISSTCIDVKNICSTSISSPSNYVIA